MCLSADDPLFALFCRPLDRTSEEIERASAHMRDASATEKFHHCLVQQMALYARYDRLDEGVLGKKFLSLEQI